MKSKRKIEDLRQIDWEWSKSRSVDNPQGQIKWAKEFWFAFPSKEADRLGQEMMQKIWSLQMTLNEFFFFAGELLEESIEEEMVEQ